MTLNMKTELYEIVCWPDVQELFGMDGFRENSYLANDDKLGSSAYFVSKEWLRANVEKFDVNARFQDFRDTLSAEVLDMIRKAGGRIDLGGGSVALEFTSVRYYNDVLGDVMAVSLTLSEEEPDRVLFTYVTPEWCENNSDYIDEGDDEAEHEVALDELSANELYSILKLINIG